jgi:hypothetical protein
LRRAGTIRCRLAGTGSKLLLERLYLGEQQEDGAAHRPPLGVRDCHELLSPAAKLLLLAFIHTQILAHGVAEIGFLPDRGPRRSRAPGTRCPSRAHSADRNLLLKQRGRRGVGPASQLTLAGHDFGEGARARTRHGDRDDRREADTRASRAQRCGRRRPRRRRRADRRWDASEGGRRPSRRAGRRHTRSKTTTIASGCSKPRASPQRTTSARIHGVEQTARDGRHYHPRTRGTARTDRGDPRRARITDRGQGCASAGGDKLRRVGWLDRLRELLGGRRSKVEGERPSADVPPPPAPGEPQPEAGSDTPRTEPPPDTSDEPGQP